MARRFALVSLAALAGCGESPLVQTVPDASATVDAAPATDLATPDLATPDLLCFSSHTCEGPQCCDPQCAGPVEYRCPNDPCATPTYRCDYFEYYCICGDDHHWQYFDAFGPVDFSFLDFAGVD
jgi:hypothetical protein